MFVRIIKSGTLTTIQDRGRYGLQDQGIPVCGALDPLAMTLADLLVDNDANAPVMECMGMGPVLQFSDHIFFSVCGSGYHILLNERQLPINAAYEAEKNDILKIIPEKGGRICTVAFGGKMNVLSFAGSYATDMKSMLGPFGGRALKDMDAIEITEEKQYLANFSSRRIPTQQKEKTTVLHVMRGPQSDMFTEDVFRHFLQEPYTVSKDADRMGIRLNGAPVHSEHGSDILSCGVVTGSIQITDDMPILLMNDHAVSGGYAVIAVVISSDLYKAARLSPGDTIRFAQVTMKEAEQLRRQQEEMIIELQKTINTSGRESLKRRRPAKRIAGLIGEK